MRELYYSAIAGGAPAVCEQGSVRACATRVARAANARTSTLLQLTRAHNYHHSSSTRSHLTLMLGLSLNMQLIVGISPIHGMAK